MSRENLIRSYDAFENAINNLRELATRINQTLEKTQRVYEEQGSGWYSANSNMQMNKMTNYTEDAKTIAKNITEISNIVSKFEKVSQSIDEEGSAV